MLDTPRTDCPEKLPDVNPSFEDVPAQPFRSSEIGMSEFSTNLGLLVVSQLGIIDE